MTAIEFPLERGEKLLWSGAPRQGLVLRPTDTFMIPFSVMWGGFVVFWEYRVTTTEAPLFMRLWGIPFLVMGAYIMIGRFIHDAWRRTGTTYAVTTDRVIIAASGPFASLKSLSLGTLTDIVLTEKPDGSGSIAFGRPTQRQEWASGQWGGGPPVPTFEMIPGAKQVYNVLRDAQARLRAPSAVSSPA
jgi:hypothetical protein